MSIQDGGIINIFMIIFFNDLFSNGIIVNFVLGMLMVGGIFGLDIYGNSWGINFNEFLNMYDFNWGY